MGYMASRRYRNLDNVTIRSSLAELIKWYKERMEKQKDLSYQVPAIENPDIQFLQENREMPTITWIGHSTFLIQLNGLNIITDPVWTKWLSTYKRLAPPGIPLNKMPPIDIVLISHSHYDHLSYTTIKRLPGNPMFLVPAGLGKWFLRKGLERTVEFEWWGTHKIKRTSFTFVPAQHWTRRTLLDTNRSHWGGWMIQSESEPSIYFAGDSGYFRGFSEIGNRFSIDYALMPIGAYEPEWFMKSQHVTPEEAVQAFIDTKAKYMVPMHYGAYRLADDTPREALDRLYAEWERQGLDSEILKVFLHGETENIR